MEIKERITKIKYSNTEITKKTLQGDKEITFWTFLITIPEEENRGIDRVRIFKNKVLRLFHKDVNIHTENAN